MDLSRVVTADALIPADVVAAILDHYVVVNSEGIKVSAAAPVVSMGEIEFLTEVGIRVADHPVAFIYLLNASTQHAQDLANAYNSYVAAGLALAAVANRGDELGPDKFAVREARESLEATKTRLDHALANAQAD